MMRVQGPAYMFSATRYGLSLDLSLMVLPTSVFLQSSTRFPLMLYYKPLCLIGHAMFSIAFSFIDFVSTIVSQE